MHTCAIHGETFLITCSLSSAKESLIKIHSWDKCAVRCILKQIIVRTALNENPSRRYFVSAKRPLPTFSGPLDYSHCCSISFDDRKYREKLRLVAKSLYLVRERSSRERERKRKWSSTISSESWNRSDYSYRSLITEIYWHEKINF